LTAHDGYRAALAWIELSTGTATARSGTQGQVLDEIARLRPAEILIPELPSGQPHEIQQQLKSFSQIALTTRPGWQFSPHHARDQIHRQRGATTSAALGLPDDDPSILATGAA